MSALMAERREAGEAGRQESLFEALASPRVPARNPWAPPLKPPDRPPEAERGDETLPLDDAVESPEAAALVAPPQRDELEAEAFVGAPLEVESRDVETLIDEDEVGQQTDVAGESRTPRLAGAPLAGPTLDDVMSRVWEGLATGLPAACPVCHGEVVPVVGGPLLGRCESCGTMID